MGNVWRYKTGKRGATVTVWRQREGGQIRIRYPDPAMADGYRRLVLGDVTERFAIREAERVAEALENGELVVTEEGEPTFDRLFHYYERERTPEKSRRVQFDDRRRFELFRRLWGNKRPSQIEQRDWKVLIADRLSGRIDARGYLVAQGNRRPVGKAPVGLYEALTSPRRLREIFQK